MDQLIDRVRQFRRDVYPQMRELFEQLASGQQPPVMMITCSDSRIDPSLITQTQPGDMFVLRNPGNIVPPADAASGAEAAAVEFAVNALRVAHIVVCGHTNCGAMAGLIRPETLSDLPYVAEWVEHAAIVREMIDQTYGLDGPEALQKAVEANVLVQSGNLQTYPAVAEALAAGTLELHGWVYDIGAGTVSVYDDRQNGYVPIGE